MWSGIITSSFKVDGKDVKVVTQGDFDSDSVAFQVESDLVKSGALSVYFDFPYPPVHTTKYKFEVFVGSYDFPSNHTTSLSRGCRSGDRAHILHRLPATSYHVNLRWPAEARLQLSTSKYHGTSDLAAHRFMLSPVSTSTKMSFTAQYSPDKRIADLPRDIQKRNSLAWNDYWTDGGFIDLRSSTNPNADELQRRIILSQYHVRVNSAATGQSPQESGLMNNGWYGMCMTLFSSGTWVSDILVGGLT